MKISNPSRLLALFTAGVLSAGVMLHPAPARADKAKNYKYGAIALGVVGGYLLSKGKTTEGAVVLGAGAYTYKKGEDARKADKYNDYSDRYNYRGSYDNSGRYNNGDYNNRGRYDNNGRYDDRYDSSYDNRDRYNVPARNRLSERENNDYISRGGDRYGDRYDDRYDNRNDNRYNDRYDNRNRNPKIR